MRISFKIWDEDRPGYDWLSAAVEALQNDYRYMRFNGEMFDLSVLQQEVYPAVRNRCRLLSKRFRVEREGGQ